YLQSRIHASRNVIRSIIEQNSDKAEFALLTFGSIAPPTSMAEVPQKCTHQVTLEKKRFTWITTSNQPYSTIWKPVTNGFGSQGIWQLCGDNRPFPYLRHDDLGGFSLPNNSADPLPDQPLYVTHSNQSAYESAANYTRRVQFFPRFMGRRTNLDCSDPLQQDIAYKTWGDFAATNADRDSEVCGHDYYYWPYVDGNPGYTFYDGKTTDNFSHQECDDNAKVPTDCVLKTDDIHRLGVVRRLQTTGGSLYAPFYSKPVLDDPNIAAADKGPLSEDDSWTMFAGAVDKQYAGGADVAGGTPMAVAMGIVENLVHVTNEGELLGPKPSLPMTNRPFGHDTIASYLSFMRLVDEDALCKPVVMIVVTDGQPDPWNKQGGAKLYERMRSIRRILSVKTYVVAYTSEVWSDAESWSRIHEIACSASGANSIPTPCDGDNDYGWDTCADKEDPANGCAWLANDKEELSATLTHIIAQAIETAVPGGAPTVANDFQVADPNDPESSQQALQTNISSWTDTPSWEGHVTRGACTDEDP
ncbi:MAG: type IV pilin biogenesis protein, partial [Myxococcales bacterium]|nr:type IV pilin biogenesis protein [Myxococcales bacterium]